MMRSPGHILETHDEMIQMFGMLVVLVLVALKVTCVCGRATVCLLSESAFFHLPPVPRGTAALSVNSSVALSLRLNFILATCGCYGLSNLRLHGPQRLRL